jgi:hypothetical protein
VLRYDINETMCPICTVTVIAGLGISRLLGIDDLITSLWIGGFILSFSFITINWMDKKWPKISIGRYTYPIIALMYLLVLVPLKLNGSIGILRNALWGIDKILLGTFVGSIVFLIGIWADKYERRVHKKILFPFQKVVFPVLGLIISSLVFYFLTK